MPLNYIKFLDYATERILLHRRGGGYAFIHRMLLEYFAARTKADFRPDPDLAQEYYWRGVTWHAKREYDRAITDYDQAIRLNSDDPYLTQAYGGYDVGYLETARYLWKSRLAKAYHGRGAARHAKREYDRAIADYDEAIRLDPDRALAYYDRGVTWHAKREYDRAIADYDQTIRLNGPDLAEAHRGIAWILATCPDVKYRDGQRAIASATRVCGLTVTDWKDANSLDVLAAACAEAGDFAHAVEYQEKAQGLYKDEKDRERGRDRLALYREKKPYRDVPEAK